MKWFLGTYTSRFNRRHKVFGHLFSGRYKSLVVDGSGNGYLRTVCDYVHLNPVRAHLLQAEEPLKEYKEYRWSSYPEYLKRAGQRPAWLRACLPKPRRRQVDRVMGGLGIQRDEAAGQQRFDEAMEQRRGKDKPGEWKVVRRGWYLGGAELKEELLEMMGVRNGGTSQRGGKARDR